MGTMGQLEDWTSPSGKLGEITAEFIMLRALGGGNREAETADTKADSVAWETWVRTKDARRAIAAERARLRPLLERCLEVIGDLETWSDAGGAPESLLADLRRELGKG